MTDFISYAQNREDVILEAYLRDVSKGSYVDIGAHHPVNDSVTKHFYEKGWRGINVEPNEDIYKQLKADRPQDTNVKAGISDTVGKLKLRIYENSGLSTFSAEVQAANQRLDMPRTNSYHDQTVPVMTLAKLLAAHPLEHIHFMKIDVEGFEYQVLAGNDWTKYRPEVICIEATRKIKEYGQLLAKNDYELVWNDGLNDYYLAKESLGRKANFNYTDAMLLNGQILPHHVVNALHKLEETTKEETLKRQILCLKVDYLTKENKILHKRLAEQRRVMNATKTLILAVDKAARYHIDAVKLRNKKTAGPRIREMTIAIEEMPAEELLERIQAADLASHYAQKGLPNNNLSFGRQAAYQVLRTAYYVPRKILSSSYKLVKKPKEPSDD